MYFGVSKETKREVEESMLPFYQNVFKRNAKLLMPYALYTTEEEVLSKYNIRDYIRLFNTANECHGIKIDMSEARKGKPIKAIIDNLNEKLEIVISDKPVVHEYFGGDYKATPEENQNRAIIKWADDTDLNVTLRTEEDDKPKPGGGVEYFDFYAPYDYIVQYIDIFKIINLDLIYEMHQKKIVFDITRYILYMRKTRGENNIYISHTNPNGTFWLKYQRDNAHYRLEKNEYNKETDRERDEMIYWATHYIIKMINNPEYVKDIYKIHNYIVDVLQFATTKDLKKLVSMTNNRFDIKLHGNPKGLTIFKFDAADKHLICSFVSRNECVEKEGMSKATLSKLLNPDYNLFTWHKRIYIEMNYEEAKKLDYNVDKMIEFVSK